MLRKKKDINNKKVCILGIYLLVVICGIWYSSYKPKAMFVFKETAQMSMYNYNTDNTDNIVENTEETVKSINDTDALIININTADVEELKILKGIGDVLAENIIKYRQEKGRFETIEEIKNVPRIGDKIFDNIKDKIEV